MSETKNPIPREAPAEWFLAAASIAICLFGQLGALGLMGPDEPRYAWIARAMAQTGDWVTPRLYGQPWFEKPILYYWAAGLGFAAHLPAEWAARLPSAVAALAAAIAIGWLGKKHYGGTAASLRSPALLAPVVFSTSVAAIGFARAAGPDMLFSASITLAMAAAAAILRRSGALRGDVEQTVFGKRGDYGPLSLFGIFLGLGVLAKGPAAVLLAGGAVALWAATAGRWRVALRLAHPLAIGAFCVVALPWYVICARRNPDFLRVFILQHNFERYLTPAFHHQQPIWFFGPIVLLALLPWTALLWPALGEGARSQRERAWRDSPGLFFACWGAFPIVFFSLSQSKLPSYILPSIPPMALICSIAAVRTFDRGRRTALVASAGIGATWVALAIASAYLAWKFARKEAIPDLSPRAVYLWAAAVVLMALVAGLVIAGAGFRQRLAAAAGLCALCAALAVEATNIGVLPLLDPVYSARSHAEFMRYDRHPERIFTYQLNRSWNFGLAFYFGRQLPEWVPTDAQPALVLTTAQGFQDILRRGRTQGDLQERRPGLIYVPISSAPR